MNQRSESPDNAASWCNPPQILMGLASPTTLTELEGSHKAVPWHIRQRWGANPPHCSIPQCTRSPVTGHTLCPKLPAAVYTKRIPSVTHRTFTADKIQHCPGALNLGFKYHADTAHQRRAGEWAPSFVTKQAQAWSPYLTIQLSY